MDISFLLVLGLSLLASVCIRLCFLPSHAIINAAMDDYSAVVTVHGYNLIFSAIPLIYFTIFWDEGDNEYSSDDETDADSSEDSSTLVVAGVLADILLYGFNSGWTLYVPVVDDGSDFIYFFLFMITSAMTVVDDLDLDSDTQSGAKILWLRSFWAVSLFSIFLFSFLFVLSCCAAADAFCGTSLFAYPCGSVFLYEELFWLFGHPEVYFLVLPV